MRVILRFLYLLILLLFLGSCTKQKSSNLGKWYSTNSGVFIIYNDSLVHFPNETPKETWEFDKKEEAFAYGGILYNHCQKQSGGKLMVNVACVDENRISLKSHNGCFFKQAFANHLTLLKIPSDLKMDFKEISFSKRVNGKWKEVIFTIDDLINFSDDEELLSIEQQIWLMFNSGIRYSNSCIDSGFDNQITLKLIGEGIFNCKIIDDKFIPEYFHMLFLNFSKDLENSEVH